MIVEGGGHLIMVFLRVYFYQFRKNICFHFRTSKESLFYVFRVFVHSRGGRSLVTCSWGSIVTFVDNVRILFFASQSRVHSMFLEFLDFVLLTKFWIWAIISFFPNRVGTLQGGYGVLDFHNYLFPRFQHFLRSGVEKTEILNLQEFCTSWGRGWPYRVNIISSISRNSVFLAVGGDRWCVNIIFSISRNSAFLEVGGDRWCVNIISPISRNSAFPAMGG